VHPQPRSADLTSQQKNALIHWVGVHVNDVGKWSPRDDFPEEAILVLAKVLVESVEDNQND
jgi:hypothetical protein